MYTVYLPSAAHNYRAIGDMFCKPPFGLKNPGVSSLSTPPTPTHPSGPLSPARPYRLKSRRPHVRASVSFHRLTSHHAVTQSSDWSRKTSKHAWLNLGTISSDDLAHFKANLAQPGALTAALNYYRAMVDASTWNPCPRGYCGASLCLSCVRGIVTVGLLLICCID